MSESNETFDDLFDENGEPKGEAAQAPKALREYAKSQAQRAKELEEKYAKLEKQQRDSSLKQFVKDKGLDETAAELIGDQNPEEWFEKYGSLLAKAESNAGEENNTDGENTGQPKGQAALTPEQIAQMQQTQDVQPGQYQPQMSDAETTSKLESLYNSDISEEQRRAQLKAMGAMV